MNPRSTILLALIVCLAGCATQHPTQQWRTASLTYKVALDGMTDLANAGELPLSDAESFELIRSQARLYLDEWAAANAAGIEFDKRDALLSLLDKMVEIARASRLE